MSDELYLRAILRYQDIDTGEYVETCDRFEACSLTSSELSNVLHSPDPLEAYLNLLEAEIDIWVDEDEFQCYNPYTFDYELGDYQKPIVYYCWNPCLEHKKYLFEWLKKHEKRKIVWGMI